jgi:aryl-alcohol dehydrogenase-like predicted oxidoreductase
LGKSELQVSVVGLGCNNFGARIDLEASRKVIDKAIDLGVTLFDTADIYGNGGDSEKILGEVLGSRRKNIILATKFGMAAESAGIQKGASSAAIVSKFDATLRRLKTDWVDLYQLHTPDPLTPVEQTLRALDDLVRQGKVRYIGCSNLPAWQVVEALWTSRQRKWSEFVSCQDEYSLVKRDPERELIPAMEKYGLGLLPYFPLASGLLSGKYKRGHSPSDGRLTVWKGLGDRYMTEKNWEIVEKLEKFCGERGHTILELAFSWQLAHPVVSSVIAGATKAEQVEQNVAATNWQLSAEDLAEVDRLTKK